MGKLGKQNMALSQVFTKIESKKEEFGILDYSVGQTTLEQIFIHFANDGEKEHRAKLRGEVFKSKLNLLEEKETKPIAKEETKPTAKEETKPTTETKIHTSTNEG